ncbi:hypothetical protein HK405_013123, partial [Cladochytrium tenue]
IHHNTRWSARPWRRILPLLPLPLLLLPPPPANHPHFPSGASAAGHPRPRCSLARPPPLPPLAHRRPQHPEITRSRRCS